MNGTSLNSAPSVRDEYTALAGSYERRWRHYLETSTAHTLTALDPRDDELILDAGCGTGLLLERIANRAPKARLVGVDRTVAMIRHAKPAVAGRIVGDVRSLPLTDGSLDAVVMASVLQYLPRPEPVLSEVMRVLRPGGRIVITTWDGGSLRVRMLARWLRWRGGADVHLGTVDDLVVACHRQRLSIRRTETYAVGYFWRLLTVVAVKNVALH